MSQDKSVAQRLAFLTVIDWTVGLNEVVSFAVVIEVCEHITIGAT
jgi:hypothetical protein